MLLSYLRLIRLQQALFTLPFIAIAMIQISETYPQSFPVSLFLKIVACFLFLRSAAMSFNRLVDRSFDAKNPRTKDREIPQKKIKINQVKIFTWLTSILFLWSAYSINFLCFLGGILLLATTFAYSYSKRWTMACHFLLGFSIGIAPIAVWIAMTGNATVLSILWSIGFFGYICGFDIFYAILDQRFDRKNNLHSIPARFGSKRAGQIGSIMYILSISAFLMAGRLSQLNMFYVLALILAGVLFTAEFFLIQKKSHADKQIALLHIVGGQVIFFGYLIGRY